MKARSAAGRALTTLAVSVAVLTGPLAPTASATDRYAFANGCYALRTIVSHKYVVRNPFGYYRGHRGHQGRGHALPHAGHRARPLPPLRARRRHAGGGPAQHRIQSTKTPGPAADWVLTRSARPSCSSRSRPARACVRAPPARSASWPPPAPRAWRSSPPPAVATFPEVEVNVTGTPFKGATPDLAGPRVHRRPHPPRRLRLPRRALPLRPALEPLRRDRRADGLP